MDKVVMNDSMMPYFHSKNHAKMARILNTYVHIEAVVARAFSG
jgi:hypothetical protein